MGLTVYGGGGKPEEEKTVTAGTSVMEVLPSSGKTMKKVTINPAPIPTELVLTSPTKTSYTAGETLDLTGIVVKAYDRSGFAFKNNYMNVVGVTFLQNLFIFLWSLLLIVPGIVKAYQYRMIPYLLAEDPNLSFSEAKRLSTEMMDGEKWDAFVLDLSFILWEILAVITFNLAGIFWVKPYMEYTNVELYKVLRTKVPGPYYEGSVEMC